MPIVGKRGMNRVLLSSANWGGGGREKNNKKEGEKKGQQLPRSRTSVSKFLHPPPPLVFGNNYFQKTGGSGAPTHGRNMVSNQDILNMYVALEPGYEGSRIVRMGGGGDYVGGEGGYQRDDYRSRIGSSSLVKIPRNRRRTVT